MRLGIRVITNYQNINSFTFAQEWLIRSGDTKTLYFQLVDLDSIDQIRYMLPSGSSVTVSFPTVGGVALEKVATQTDVLDSSIWGVSILDTDQLSSGSVYFEVVINGVSNTFAASQVLNIELNGVNGANWGGC